MRLDHLLSREPIIVGNDHGVRPVGGGLGLFSCACMCLLPGGGWWVWVRVWVGHKEFIRADTLSGSRSTPCERPPSVVVVVACAASQQLLVWVVCGGLFVICIVVASIFVLYCFLCFV